MVKFVTHELVNGGSDHLGFDIQKIPDFFEQRNSRSIYELHTHNYYEIIWFQEGGGIHTVDFVDYEIKPNTFFFITPGQLHRYEEPMRRGVVFMFVPEFLNDEYTTEDIFLKYSIFNAFDSSPCLVIEDENRLKSIACLLNGMQRELLHVEDYGHHQVMQHLLRLLLVVFQRCDGGKNMHQFNISSNVHNHFVRFRQALESEYRRLHNVKDYAALLGVGTKYLTTIVSECSHRTPLQLINDRILLESKRQLKYSNKMVKEIAFDLGFDDPSYFIKLFKRQTGMLPTDFREK